MECLSPVGFVTFCLQHQGCEEATFLIRYAAPPSPLEGKGWGRGGVGIGVLGVGGGGGSGGGCELLNRMTFAHCVHEPAVGMKE